MKKPTENGAQACYPRVDAKLLVCRWQITSVSFAIY